MVPPFSLAVVPDKPGCYLFKEKEVIIYIGKAKSLRRRVAQYFHKEHTDKTAELVRRIDDVEFFITKNEAEALLLEANLIRQHQPKYNIDLKGGRRYAYILLTDEPFPRLLTARSTALKGEYFGPFVSGYLRQTLLTTLRKSFFIRTCRTLPKKPCLRYHLGLCKAPCVGNQSREEYAANVEQVRQFLRGGDRSLPSSLKKKMLLFSDRQEFEHAREVRDQIRALEFLNEQQIVEREHHVQEDAISFLRDGSSVHILVFSVRSGVLGEKEQFKVEFTEGFFDEFLRRYYELQGSSIPSLIIVPCPVGGDTQAYLSEKASHAVEFRVPQRGSRKALLDLVEKNLDESLVGPTRSLVELQERLGLPVLPRTIECFDISHFQGSFLVGSMVQFVDARPNKRGYRRFKVRSVVGVDDFRSMQEVVGRRYKRLVDERMPLPDLIVIDGGQQQLRFALMALEEVGVEVPIIALAKKNEEIYVPGGRLPRRFPKNSEMMRLLIAARDEAHRFGVSYHRLLRNKKIRE